MLISNSQGITKHGLKILYFLVGPDTTKLPYVNIYNEIQKAPDFSPPANLIIAPIFALMATAVVTNKAFMQTKLRIALIIMVALQLVGFISLSTINRSNFNYTGLAIMSYSPIFFVSLAGHLVYLKSIKKAYTDWDYPVVLLGMLVTMFAGYFHHGAPGAVFAVFLVIKNFFIMAVVILVFHLILKAVYWFLEKIGIVKIAKQATSFLVPPAGK